MKPCTSLLIFAVFILFASCNDESDEPASVLNAVQFEATQLSFSENSEPGALTINLSASALEDGFVQVEVITQNENSFTTIPPTLSGMVSVPVVAGSKTATLTVVPVNTTILEGDRSATFRILVASKGLSIGPVKETVITITDDEQRVQVNFLTGNTTIEESSNGGTQILIGLSASSPGAGQLQLSLQSENANYGEHFITVPPASNGIVSISISPGLEQAALQIIPVNDSRIYGNKHIAIIMLNSTGAITLGTNNGHSVTIKDDELHGVSKGYNTTGGGWGARRYFAYNDNGQLAKVSWEQYTPDYSGGSYMYQYAGMQLEKMFDSDGSETIYTTVDGRITKSEKFKSGVLKQYTLYGYDDAGNVGEASHFYRQASGEMKLGLIFVYLYFLDGNLYKQLTYNPNVDGEPALISTHTYDNYLSIENPFPIEILPNKATQRHLPGILRLEEGGSDVTYSLSYEFDTEGRVRKRTATSSAGREVTNYSFY